MGRNLPLSNRLEGTNGRLESSLQFVAQSRMPVVYVQSQQPRNVVYVRNPRPVYGTTTVVSGVWGSVLFFAIVCLIFIPMFIFGFVGTVGSSTSFVVGQPEPMIVVGQQPEPMIVVGQQPEPMVIVNQRRREKRKSRRSRRSRRGSVTQA